MASRECDKCARRFGAGIANTATCVFCGGSLTYMASTNPNVSPDEYDQRLYVCGKKVPKSLSAEEAIRFEREWADLHVEQARRGPSWSVADLIGDAFGCSVRST